jgi:hypothetical protein
MKSGFFFFLFEIMIFVVVLLWETGPVCSPGWPQIFHPPTSASLVLALQV